jgi:sugar lactone lactonase YvrE
MDTIKGRGVIVTGARQLASGLNFPECLRWRTDGLWFADQYAGTICRLDESGGITVVATVPGRPGGLGWTPDGLLLAVSMEHRTVMTVAQDGRLSPYADLAPFIGDLANDMLVDAQGRAYIGNYGFDYEHGEEPAPTRLIRVDPDRSVHFEEPWMLFPNGMALVDRGHRLVTAETLGDRLTVCAVEPDGNLVSPELLAELPAGSGPDGIAVDSANRVWVACAFTSRAVAVTLDGTIDAEIELPGEGIYCCEVGGADHRTLFLAIAPLDESLAAREPHGRIISVPL